MYHSQRGKNSPILHRADIGHNLTGLRVKRNISSKVICGLLDSFPRVSSYNTIALDEDFN